ncbi:hypothetical protein ABBQ32_002513 [Trebouxia sp. C0010 RCD-2024]
MEDPGSSHGKKFALLLAGTAAVALAAAYYSRRRSSKRSGNNQQALKLQKLLEKYRKSLDVSAETLCAVRDEMVTQMNTTLSGSRQSSLMMLPSMVDELPNGFESGDFFALDMGGTNFRTVYVKLADTHGDMDDLQMDEFPLGEDMHHLPGDKLFDFMAEKLVKFAERIGKKSESGQLPVVGFCFSFPLKQKSVNHGTLIKWNKGFTNSESVGEDPTDMLEAALARQGMKSRVMSLVNDTVATLAACRYQDQDTMIGVILGTGSNGAYVERAEHVHNAAKKLPKGANMIVNCEWGNLTTDVMPRIDEDKAIDAESVNPDNQHFEKMTAGLYMGEIARRIIQRLAEEGALFGRRVPAGLRTKNSLSTPQMSKIDHDTSTDLLITADILQKACGLAVDQITFHSTEVVQEICHLVGWRAGRLKAAAIAAVMRQLDREDGTRTVVGVDGGVFEHYGYYRDAIKAGLVDIMGKKAAEAVEFRHVNDGSSLGAAYLAAAKIRAESLQNGDHSESESDLGKENRGMQEGPSTHNKSGDKAKKGRQADAE